MTQTFRDAKTGEEAIYEVLHIFESKDVLGRNIVLIESKESMQLAYVRDDKIEIIENIDELNLKCKNLLEKIKDECDIDIALQTNTEVASRKITSLNSEIRRIDSELFPLEIEKENLENEEKEHYEKKNMIIRKLGETYSGANFDTLRRIVDSKFDELEQTKDIKRRKQELDDKLYESKYHEKRLSQEEIEHYLGREKTRLASSINSMPENYNSITKMNKDNAILLQVMQCVENLKSRESQKNDATKLTSEQLQQLNRYESLKGKCLSYKYKVKYYDELEKNGIRLTKIEDKMCEMLHKKIDSLEHEIQLFEGKSRNLISRSIYSNQDMCNLLVFDKACRETEKYMKKQLDKKNRIEKKKEEQNKQQIKYRKMQQEIIEANENERYDKDLRDTSLESIIRSENSIFKKAKDKLSDTAPYMACQKIVGSKFMQKTLAAKLVRKIKDKRIKFKEFGRDLDDFYNNTSNYYNNKRNGL